MENRNSIGRYHFQIRVTGDGPDGDGIAPLPSLATLSVHMLDVRDLRTYVQLTLECRITTESITDV